MKLVLLDYPARLSIVARDQMILCGGDVVLGDHNANHSDTAQEISLYRDTCLVYLTVRLSYDMVDFPRFYL